MTRITVRPPAELSPGTRLQLKIFFKLPLADTRIPVPCF